jgi:predicted metalloprotease with PDZ domain
VEPVRYRLSFPAPHTHYAEVSVDVPTDGRDEIELMMAVWTPGSYLVREFSRHVEQIAASSADGTPLAVRKTRKNRWAVATGGGSRVSVSYRVYGREMSVRTNWIEAGFALINGAPTFMTPADLQPRRHEIIIEPADGWTQSCTALPGNDDARRHHYVAADYDRLVDSPILLGNPAVHGFTVDGKPHALVNEGDTGMFDGTRAARDLERIVHAYRRMWGALPYERYLFLNVITEAGGGLEHADSTVLMTTRWATRTRKAYLDWLGLASHEFFHVWNVKRLRPVELGPFAYEQEVHTRGLWVAEGFTDYYADLMVHRAGLTTRDEYLDELSSKIEGLQTTPGRLVQSVTQASFDAWIKHYRPDENSINTAISYYTKGAVIAFLLDARIRASSHGQQTLDDVMRAAYRRFSGPRGFTGDEIRDVIEEVAGVRFADFWAGALDSTSELDYGPALDVLGLRFATPPAAPRVKAWLGATTKNDLGRLVVAQVRRDGPAHGAGLNVDDELLAIDGIRVRADRFDDRLDQYRPGDRAVLLVARRERLMDLEITFGGEPSKQWRLEVAPTLTAPQADQLTRWLQPVYCDQ